MRVGLHTRNNPFSSLEWTGFRVSGFVFRVSCLGFRVSGLGFRVPVLVFRVLSFVFRVRGSGVLSRVSGFRFRVSGFGFRVSVCRAVRAKDAKDADDAEDAEDGGVHCDRSPQLVDQDSCGGIILAIIKQHLVLDEPIWYKLVEKKGPNIRRDYRWNHIFAAIIEPNICRNYLVQCDR